MKYFFFRKKDKGVFTKSGLIVVFTIFNLSGIYGQNAAADMAYHKTAEERAGKIVAGLALKDSGTFYKVKEVVAQQYIALHNLDANQEGAARSIRETTTNKEAIAKKITAAETKAAEGRTALHQRYLHQLSGLLPKEKVEAIKNGMTYNVLPITYKGYLEMIPRLTAEERKYIMEALTEAREHAMDAGSSEKKHAWFGKYKGRINNYLSARGYDMNKESKAWQERMKANQNKKQQPKQ